MCWNCLWSAQKALGWGWQWAGEAGLSYRHVIRHAIAFGNDTDTTAAVAGGIAGIRTGLSGLPADWLAVLRGKDLLRRALARLEWAGTF
jgi:ADP-ribosylglycohydrolase